MEIEKIDKLLQNAGVTDIYLFKSLGIFTINLVLLMLILTIYLLLFTAKSRFILRVRNLIYKKLFYNGFLRYMLVSNLKLNYTLWGFFFLLL